MRKTILFLFLAFPWSLLAQISITGPSFAYLEDFASLASTGTSSTLPTGWAFSESGTNANSTYAAGTGSSNAGDTYSFGAASSSERALGGLLSGALVPTFGVQFKNDLGYALTSLAISYNGEQWRLGTTGRVDRLDFQFSTNATSLTTGTWVDFNALDFSSPNTVDPVGPLDGNANTFPVMATLSAASTGNAFYIANGATFWFRWVDFNASGSDDGLAVDNFAISSALPIKLVNFTANRQQREVLLKWLVASEENNRYFSLERSGEGQRFEPIGEVAGRGTTSQPLEYTFTDHSPLPNLNYYRLRQVDFDGTFSYSPIVAVDVPDDGRAVQLSPNPVADRLNIRCPPEVYSRYELYDAQGRLVQSGTLPDAVGQTELDVAALHPGTYALRLLGDHGVQAVSFVKN